VNELTQENIKRSVYNIITKATSAFNGISSYQRCVISIDESSEWLYVAAGDLSSNNGHNLEHE